MRVFIPVVMVDRARSDKWFPKNFGFSATLRVLSRTAQKFDLVRDWRMNCYDGRPFEQ
jgi:hypothetical protein